MGNALLRTSTMIQEWLRAMTLVPAFMGCGAHAEPSRVPVQDTCPKAERGGALSAEAPLVGPEVDDPSRRRDAPVAAIDGIWEGSLAVVSRDTARPGLPLSVNIRIIIRGETVALHFGGERGWEEIKPGAFRVTGNKANAIVYAVDDGRDNDGVWVETQNVSLTRSSGTVLRAIYVRLVNNMEVPRTEDKADWWVVAVGDLNRKSEGHSSMRSFTAPVSAAGTGPRDR